MSSCLALVSLPESVRPFHFWFLRPPGLSSLSPIVFCCGGIETFFVMWGVNVSVCFLEIFVVFWGGKFFLCLVAEKVEENGRNFRKFFKFEWGLIIKIIKNWFSMYVMWETQIYFTSLSFIIFISIWERNLITCCNLCPNEVSFILLK